MGFFDIFKRTSINEHVAKAGEAGALLVDVRSADEYANGHIPGAVNAPLGEVASFANGLQDKGQVLYVYCHSGMRSVRACKELRSMGFSNVTNIGGMGSYRGPVER